MELEARALAAGLRDPLRPAFCAACLLCFRDHLDPAVRKTNLRTLRADHHGFWRGVILFLTAKRTRTAHVTAHRLLTSTMRACSSPFRTRQDHDEPKAQLSDGHDLVQEVVGSLIDLVYMCLEDSSRRMVVTQRFSTHGLWPTCTADILAHGVDNSLAALLEWYTIIGDSTMAWVFEDIFLICADELREPLMRDANRRTLLEATCLNIDFAASQLREGGDEEGDSCSPEVCISAISRLLRAIVYGTGSQPDSGRLLFRGHETEFLRSAESAIPLLPDANERSRLADLVTLAYDARGTPLMQRPRATQQQTLAIRAKLGDAYRLFQTMLENTRDSRTCAASDCGLHERELGRKLQLCASCGVVRYCSRECQRRHWKAEELPHKAACGRISDLVPVLDRDDAEFAAAARALGFNLPDMARIYDNITGGILGDNGMSAQARVEHITAVMAVHDAMHNMSADPAVLLQEMSALGIGSSPP